MTNKQVGKRLLVALLVMGLSFAFALQGPVLAAVNDGYFGGTLEVAYHAEPVMLDKCFAVGLVGWEILVNVVEPLFEYDENWEIQPFLVEDYRIGNDGQLYVLDLRQGVKFHNGQEMTSDDVVSSIERFGSHNSYFKDYVTPYLVSIKAVDRYTVEIALNAPVWLVPYILQECPIYPQELNAQYPNNPIPPAELVGTGPYQFSRWIEGSFLELAKFEGYSADSRPFSGHAGERIAYLDKIKFNFVPEMAIRLAGVQTNEYHVAFELNPETFSTVDADTRLQALVTKPYGFPYYQINKAGGALSDPENVQIRRALLTALDMEELMMIGFGDPNLYEVDGSVYSKSQVAWHSASGLDKFDQADPKKAKQMLEEAGYYGEPIRILTSTEYDFLYKQSVVLRDQLVDAGFNVDLQVVDWGTLLDRRGNKDAYEIFISYNSFSSAPPLRHGWLVSGFAGWWTNPEKDRLVAELVNAVEYEEQYAVWEQLQALMYEQVPVIVPGHFYRLGVATQAVQGLQARFVMPLFNVWLEK